MILMIMMESWKNKCGIIFLKSKTKFCLCLHYNGFKAVCILIKHKPVDLRVLTGTTLGSFSCYYFLVRRLSFFFHLARTSNEA